MTKAKNKVNENTKPDKAYFSCKFDRAFYNLLVGDAQKNRRSLNSHVIWICEQHLDNMNKEQ